MAPDDGWWEEKALTDQRELNTKYTEEDANVISGCRTPGRTRHGSGMKNDESKGEKQASLDSATSYAASFV